MYLDDQPARRFLIADEVGLGKTHVARGLVARVLHWLWDKQERVTVVYVCSSGAIARQNLSRLNITNEMSLEQASRVTMLPRVLPQLNRNRVNFVAFTPATSFDLVSRSGKVQERAMLFHLLQPAWELRLSAGVCNLLAAGAKPDTVRWAIEELRNEAEISEYLAELFRNEVSRQPELREEFFYLRDRFRDGPFPAGDISPRRNAWVGKMRALLARTCLGALQPDLIILDEFQRFKNLLRDDPDDDETAVPAKDFFGLERARILLLSATPYKMYTLAQETDEDHFRDFLLTLDFLLNDSAALQRFEQLLGDYRKQLFRLEPNSLDHLRQLRNDLEARLRRVMSRTERLATGFDLNAMVTTVATPAVRVEAADLSAYLALQSIARLLDVPDITEYWKSAPYLLNFMEQYQLARAFDEALITSDSQANIARLLGARNPALLNWQKVRKYGEIDPANARVRGLVDDTVGRGWWKLLWVPPSLPYYLLNGLPASPDARRMTKRLVFSAWKVVPKALATLVSYAAEREMIRSSESAPENTVEARKNRRPLLRFAFSRKSNRLTGLPALALIYPSLVLAEAGDPLALAAASADLPTVDESLRLVRARLSPRLDRLTRQRASAGTGVPDKSWYWAAPLLLDAAEDRNGTCDWLAAPDRAATWSGSPITGHRESRYWPKHVEEARRVVDGGFELGQPPDDLLDVLCVMAIGAPGVCCLRALARGVGSTTDPGIRGAAAFAAWPFISLFNSPEAIALLGGRKRKGSYWKKVLRYTLNGCLQAVLDEYAHLLREALSVRDAKPATAAWTIAEKMRESLSVRTSSLGVARIRPNPQSGEVVVAEQTMRARFAMRFGDERDDEGGETRADQVREAFNSPFWPFVLVTTSVGQEGLDFHPYCHAVVHWNLPANPVDLEQREGRVNRYKNHAVRRNLASQYSHVAFAPDVGDPWEVMFDAAQRGRPSGQSDLIPYWLMPADDGARVERHVPAVPLSRDVDRMEDLRRSLAVYRLVFGQSRQEDLLAFLASHCPPEQLQTMARELRMDLQPKSEIP
jgi:hypothetical protein